jgi:hypothetical protein
MPAMETFVAKHATKIRGMLSCFDRMLFRGYLPLMSGWAMADFLRSKQVDRWKLKPFLLEQAERIKKHAGVMASQTGRPYQYLPARAHPRQGPDLVPVSHPGLCEWPRVARAPTRPPRAEVPQGR